MQPWRPAPGEDSEITGLTDEDLKDEAPFKNHITMLINFFLGEEHLIAHNVAFDVDLLRFELMRIGRLWKFPWPPNHICTVNSSMSYKGRRLKLHELHFMATGTTFEGAHRAMVDVEALHRCVVWLLEEKKILI